MSLSLGQQARLVAAVDGSTLAEPQVLNSMRAILPSLDGVARAGALTLREVAALRAQVSMRVLEIDGRRALVLLCLAPLTRILRDPPRVLFLVRAVKVVVPLVLEQRGRCGEGCEHRGGLPPCG